MKKFICVFCALMLICTGVFAAEPIYTKTSKSTVTGSVSRKSIQKFYGDYALNINLVTADLTDKNLSFELLKASGGSDKVDTVMNLASARSDVVAAINADFFSAYKNNQNFSLGIEVKDGELLQSHINSDMAAGFFDGESLDFSYIDFKGTVTAPGGASSALAHINKPTDYYGAVLMYTPAFNGGTSPFLPNGITALTVVDDVVTAKGVSLGGTIPIPEEGYILVIDDNMTPFLEYNFNIGDEVKIDLSLAEFIEGTDTAFGGGTLLLKDGKKTAITHDVSGDNPRSVVGTNADGTVVYFMTVDGRQTISSGVSLATLQDLCLEMGMVNAMNLDGGGSTAIVGKSLSNPSLQYMNSPSEKRKVINAVAITSSAKSGKTAGFIIAPASSYVLSGDSVKLHLTPYDENYNKPTDSPTNYTWKVKEGQGNVKNNVYYAKGSGKTVLELYFDGKANATCEINVIDEVCGINAPATLSVKKDESTSISGISVFDKYGNTAPVTDISLLDPAYDKSFLSLSGNSVKALTEGSGLMTLYCDDARKSIRISTEGYKAPASLNVTDDPLYKDTSGGFSFNVLAATASETLLDKLIYKRGMEIFAEADASAVIGGEYLEEYTPSGVSLQRAQSFAEKDHKNAKVISVDLTDKGVLGRGSQWTRLNTALKNASQKNVIVLLDSNPGFVASLDKSAFESVLQTAAKTKNVFVVYCGDENSAVIKNGVRYITVADSKDGTDVENKLENMKYLSFDITETDITYCFRNMFTFESENNEGIVIE